MKKIVTLLLTGILLSAGAMAQTKDIKKDQKVLKNTVADKKEDRHEVGKDIANLRVKRAVDDRQEVRQHRRSIRRQGRHLRHHGVKHPIQKAKHEAKVDKDKKD